MPLSVLKYLMVLHQYKYNVSSALVMLKIRKNPFDLIKMNVDCFCNDLMSYIKKNRNSLRLHITGQNSA